MGARRLARRGGARSPVGRAELEIGIARGVRILAVWDEDRRPPRRGRAGDRRRRAARRRARLLPRRPRERRRRARPRARSRSDDAQRQRRPRRRPRPARAAVVGAAADAVRRAFAVGAVATAAEAVGAASAAPRPRARIRKEREQFKRPIGTFQGVQHLLAEATCWRRRGRRRFTHAALDEDVADAAEASTIAKAYVGGAQGLQGALQVFGGIGFTWEHDRTSSCGAARASSGSATRRSTSGNSRLR